METAPTLHLDHAAYLAKGIPYADYRQRMEAARANATAGSTDAYLPLNESRMRRIEKTYTPSAAALARLAGLERSLHWLVISEHWCGDAAQTLPVMHALAEASGGRIRLAIVHRDENPALMDRYLTGTSRSIPVLIQLNDQVDVTGRWGPRPAEAQALVMKLRSDPTTAKDYGGPLHAWYAQDRQQSIERELIALLPAR